MYFFFEPFTDETGDWIECTREEYYRIREDMEEFADLFPEGFKLVRHDHYELCVKSWDDL